MFSQERYLRQPHQPRGLDSDLQPFHLHGDALQPDLDHRSQQAARHGAQDQDRKGHRRAKVRIQSRLWQNGMMWYLRMTYEGFTILDISLRCERLHFFSNGLHNKLSWGVCLTYYAPSISPQLTCNSPPGSTTTSRSTTPRTWPSTTRPRRRWPAPRTASTATSSVSGSSPWRGSERAPTSTQVRENKSSDQNDQ